MAYRFAMGVSGVLLLCSIHAGAQVPLPSTPAAMTTSAAASHPLLQLGPGDQVKMEVFGRPEMDTTTYLGEDGTIRVPLAGAVNIGGLSPGEAAQKVEVALKSGQFLVDPHVTFTVLVSRSQRVSVLGEVRTPGRYAIESNTTVLDLLAQAGGATEKGADTIYILRTDSGGALQRFPVDLKGTVNAQDTAPAVLQTLHSGDSIFVPVAPQFYVAGEVRTTGAFRLDNGTTVVQAIAKAGGVTERGSARRVSIKRRDPKGGYRVFSPKADEKVQPDAVITVKERIF